MKDFTLLLPGLERIVYDAIAVILPLYAVKDLLVEHKKDGSPVTEADHAAEKAILAGLSALTPDIPIVSEEQMAAGHCPDCSRGLWWCVDPIDGTREFIARTDEFSVSIGLIFEGYPVLGALGVPVPGLLYIGGSGLGAWRIAQGERRKIQTRPPPREGLTALVSRSHRDGSKADIALAARGASRTVPCGSAWKFGKIAEGAADITIRYGQTCEWDTAGGQAILEGAGGFVQTLDKARLTYGKPDFVNGPFQGFATQEKR